MAKDNLEPLRLEIDLRLVSLYEFLGERESFDREFVFHFMRAVYAQGYKDCCHDPDPGLWARELGYDLSPRTRPTKS